MRRSRNFAAGTTAAFKARLRAHETASLHDLFRGGARNTELPHDAPSIDDFTTHYESTLREPAQRPAQHPAAAPLPPALRDVLPVSREEVRTAVLHNKKGCNDEDGIGPRALAILPDDAHDYLGRLFTMTPDCASMIAAVLPCRVSL